MRLKSGVKRSATPSPPCGSVRPRTMSTIMKSHMSGTKMRTAPSMLSMPRRRMWALSAQTTATRISTPHELNRRKKNPTGFGSVVPKAVTCVLGCQSGPKEPSSMPPTQARIVM